jgi:hypothetical protein
MRQALLALVATTLTCGAAHAQASWADKMFQQGPTPDPKETWHDFGNVAYGAQLFHQFTIKNIYAVKLQIMPPRVSCGCVTATPSVTVLEPHQKATIDVSMNASRFSGPKEVTIYVTVGPDYVSTATLKVSANSRRDVVFNPGQVSFGVVPKGQERIQPIDVEYAGYLDWRVNEVITGNAPVDVQIKELYRRPGQPGQVGYRIEVRLKPDAPPGALKHELALRTNDPASPLVPLLVEGTVQAPLTVAPSTVSLGPIRLGEEKSGRVCIRGRNQPFRVVAVEGLSDGLRAELPPTAADVQFVTLYCRGEKPGEFRRHLQIRTDIPGEQPLSITVEGRVEKGAPPRPEAVPYHNGESNAPRPGRGAQHEPATGVRESPPARDKPLPETARP